MTILIAGVLIWIGVHLIPALARPMRQNLIDKMGNNVYRGLFALAILASLILIVVGWRASAVSYVYVLPASVKTIAFLLICVSIIVIGSAHHPSAIKRFIRHPMLTGVALWAVAHLLVNGSSRAIVLFGGLGLWALVEIILINKREGAYTKPEAPDFSEELKGIFFSGAILVVLLLAHPYFAGVAPFPR